MQIFKIPVLVQHYLEHKSEDAALTLISFLTEHYSNPDAGIPGSYDDKQNKKLPFITPISLLGVIYVPSGQHNLSAKPYFPSGTEFIPHDSEVLYSDLLHPESIWKPPKSC